MIIIEGFQLAKSVLSRQTPTEFYPVSPALGQRLKKMFGTEDPEQAVRQIINEVRSRGDAALFDFTLKIDGIELTSLEVSKQQIVSAYQEADSELVSALKLAAERIHSFHSAQKDNIWHEVAKAGLGQLIRPLSRIGIYVPGGTAQIKKASPTGYIGCCLDGILLTSMRLWYTVDIYEVMVYC